MSHVKLRLISSTSQLLFFTMSMEECPKTTDARNESQPEQQGEMSAAKSPDMFMYFLKGDAGRMRARHDPSSSCSLISRALLDKRQCADDICQDDDMSDQCSHGARIGIFEHYIQKSTESIPVTFCVVEYEMGYPIIVGRVVQEVPKTSVVDTTVAEGQPFGPLVPGNETNGKMLTPSENSTDADSISKSRSEQGSPEKRSVKQTLKGSVMRATRLTTRSRERTTAIVKDRSRRKSRLDSMPSQAESLSRTFRLIIAPCTNPELCFLA